MDRAVRLTTVATREDDWYVARAVEVEVEVASQGRTVNEVLANLREALELPFEDEPAPPVSDGPIDVRLSA